MVCIYCSAKTQVANSRTSKKTTSTWRRRICTSCHAVFTTREAPDLENSLRVISSSTALEPFRRDKIFVSLLFSMSHRKSALSDSEGLTDTIITKVVPLHQNGLISALEIAAICADVLKRFDHAAYTYYIAHYQS